MALWDRVKGAWNTFVANDREVIGTGPDYGPSTGNGPERVRLRVYSEKTIITSIYTRMAIDISGIGYRHVKLDDKARYSRDMDTPLNRALTLEANLDQAPRHFRQDIVDTLFAEGCCAIVPVDTSENPANKERVDIYTLRVGRITQWYPRHVRVELYNEAIGRRQELVLEKKTVAIVENPLYAVMNSPNSTLQRLLRKLSLLDAVDEQSGSGKLDIIIQLPYVVKSEARKAQAKQRREDMQEQLKDSQYGVAYADATEKITQLNRPAENNLLKQVEYLTDMLYGQLGITKDVMNGTADEATMLNYYNRTIEPIIDAISEAMQRSFLGLTGTLADERIMYFWNPLKLVPMGQLAEIADKLTRNEILTSNDMRGIIGFAPSDDPKADQLVNSNMPQPQAPIDTTATEKPPGLDTATLDKVMEEVFDGLSEDLDKISGGSS